METRSSVLSKELVTNYHQEKMKIINETTLCSARNSRHTPVLLLRGLGKTLASTWQRSLSHFRSSCLSGYKHGSPVSEQGENYRNFAQTAWISGSGREPGDHERQRLLLLLRAAPRRAHTGTAPPGGLKWSVYSGVLFQEVSPQPWAGAWPMQQHQQYAAAAASYTRPPPGYSAQPSSSNGQGAGYSQMRTQQPYHNPVPGTSGRGYQERRYSVCFN